MTDTEPKEENKKIAEEIYSAIARGHEKLLLSAHLKMLISEVLDIQAERYEKRIEETKANYRGAQQRRIELQQEEIVHLEDMLKLIKEVLEEAPKIARQLWKTSEPLNQAQTAYAIAYDIENIIKECKIKLGRLEKS